MIITGVAGSGVPVGGIASSGASMHQGQFDQLKEQVQGGTVARNHALHELTAAAFQYIPKPKTDAGPGNAPMWLLTPQTLHRLIEEDQTSGYSATRLGSAFPPNSYQGHMLNQFFHMLDPVYRGLEADFHA